MSMLGAYIVAAIVGGGLILFSALAGMESHGDIGGGDFGHGGDVGHDAGVNHEVGHNHDSSAGTGALWLPFLTLRFWTYAVGTFGLIGLLLSLTKVSTEPLTMVVSVATGILMGTIAALLVRMLSRNENSSSVSDQDFLGALAKVSVPIGALPGKVRTSVKGDIIDMVAVGENGEKFQQGEEVMIVGMEGNSARVVRKDDYLGESS